MKRTILFAFIIYTFTGCFLKSVHPLVTSETATTIQGIEGTWSSDDQRWTFIRDPKIIPTLNTSGVNFLGSVEIETDENTTVFSDENIYFIIFENLQSQEEDTTLFIGYAGDIGGKQFLDLSLFETGLEDDTFKGAHLFPVHSFSRISINNDNLLIEFLKDNWIKELILNNQVRISHERIPDSFGNEDDQVLITASTPELRKFVEKYSSDERAFEDPIGLNRVNNEL